ncbi:hypothetical protein [Stenotrophomonas maltophilia]|nr:hypothetical protein [Stenotrophomonas maltophilia]
MKDILHMVLSEFWPFVAALMLISATGSAVAEVIKAIGTAVAEVVSRGGA